MSRFVEFDDGNTVINIDRIDGFIRKDRNRKDEGTLIFVGSDIRSFEVPESLEEVLSKINTEIYSYRISL